MTIDFDGYLHIVWGDSQSNRQVNYMKLSNDGDGTFTIEKGPIPLFCLNGESCNPNGIQVNENGDLFVGVNRDDDEYFYVRHSSDDGETWTTVYSKYAAGQSISCQGPYQDPNRAHTYLDEGCGPLVYVNETSDDYLWLVDDDQGDYLVRWPDESPEDIDGGDWSRKCKLTIDHDKIDSDLTNFPVIFSHDTLPVEIFTYAQGDGDDIRFSRDESGEDRLAVDIRVFDTGDEIANICVSYTGDISSSEDTEWYVWYGNSDAACVSKGEEFGGANVYDSNFVAVYPLFEVADGSYDFRNRTRNGHTMSSENMDSGNRVSGEITHGQDFNGTNERIELSDWLINDYPFTISAVGTRDPAGAAIFSYICQARTNTLDHWLQMRIQPDGKCCCWLDDGPNSGILSTNTLAVGVRGWMSAFGASNYSRAVQLNTVARNTTTTPQDFPTTDPNFEYFDIGSMHRASSDYYEGPVEEVRISNSVRVQAWTDAEYYNIFEPLNFFTTGTPEDAGPVAVVLRRHMCNLMID